MRLTKKAIEKISERKTVLELAIALNFGELWIGKCIEHNKENGPLTTAKALQVIRAETGLSDSEILTESVEKTIF